MNFTTLYPSGKVDNTVIDIVKTCIIYTGVRIFIIKGN